jgi:glucokinase
VALLGPGTGLGVSGLIPDGRGHLLPLAGEGGHVSLGAQTLREFQVVQALQQRHGHASAERALSGAGLSHVHAALVELDHGQPLAEPLSPAEVTARGLPGPGQEALCAEALGLFATFLGRVAGNLALTLGARGGVWVGGGIPPRLGHAWWAGSGFREAFEAKGRFRAYLAEVPVWFIDTEDPPALRGAAQALR